MPHSLRAKLSSLRHNGAINDNDYKRLCKALDLEKQIEGIKAAIDERYDIIKPYDIQYAYGLGEALEIIDRHLSGKDCRDCIE